MSAEDMTKRVVARSYGGPEVLELQEVALTDPPSGQVLVDVKAAGTNRSTTSCIAATWATIAAPCPCRSDWRSPG